MRFELDPPNGITGFPIGMTAADLIRAARKLGRVKVESPGSTEPFDVMKVHLLHPQFDVIFSCEDGATLAYAELWAPEPGPEEFTVTWRGLDVFQTPALELLERIRALGHQIDETEAPYHYTVPALPLGFTREAGHEVPLAQDGEPLYLQAVGVGGPGYYDRQLPEIDPATILPEPLRYRFDIDPPHGVTGFRFGMPEAEVIRAAAPLGHVRVHDPGMGEPDIYPMVDLVRPSFSATFACEDGCSLTALQLRTPYPVTNGDQITVEFRGIDVFGSPAREVAERIEALGYTIGESVPEGVYFPELSLSLGRVPQYDNPDRALADDGFPPHFQSVYLSPAP